jgi:hypothetical protein
VFPADGEYAFEVTFTNGDNSRFEDIDISIDGQRVALLAYENGPQIAADGSGATPLFTEPVLVKAGQHKVAAAFIKRSDGPYEDLIKPHEWSNAGGGSGGGGVTTLPQLRDLAVRGPYKTTGVSMTPSRQKIFTCRPTSKTDERACAKQIVTRLAGEAYRRPATAPEVDRLMPFYENEAAKNGFEAGVRASLEAILASPHFIFRLERAPTDARSGGTYRVADVDLASRLSFFIWGLPPDQQLIDAAQRRELSTLAGLEKHARRMLADPRSEALGDRFAAQWLRLQDVDKVRPDHHFYSYWDTTLSQAMVRETELFVDSLIREDRPVTDLLTADHTFVNERLAKHYGIPNILGDQYRRVTIADVNRRGVLGQGSVLLLTSIADRTSPVLRGKWVMEVLLGSPPPPPPPNVPLLEETKGVDEGRTLSTRERMEMHRKNPSCNSCHRVIDPLGLALDNYDVTGLWRIRDNGAPVDPSGELYDGTKLDGPVALRNALLKHQDVFMLSFTESLMTYALGRRVEYYDMPAIRQIVNNAKAKNYRFSAFISGVATSAAFRMAKVAPADVTTEHGR